MKASFRNDAVLSGIVAAVCEGGFEGHIRVGLLTGERRGDEIIVDGVLVPEQRSDVTSSRAEPEDIASLLMKSKDPASTAKSIVGLVTYYHHMATETESEVSRSTRQQMANAAGGKSMIGLTVNNRGRHSFHTA